MPIGYTESFANKLNEFPHLHVKEAEKGAIEVGNILFNACLGTFGNMLSVHITFFVPRLHLCQLNDMLSTLVMGNEEIRYTLVVATKFNLKDSEIGGYPVIVLGVASLDRLIECIDKLC